MSEEQIDPDQIECWAEKLGRYTFDLEQAIGDVGRAVDAVKRRLNWRVGRTVPEIAFWSRKLECSAIELEQALVTYGSIANAAGGYPPDQVMKWLSRGQPPPGPSLDR